MKYGLTIFYENDPQPLSYTETPNSKQLTTFDSLQEADRAAEVFEKKNENMQARVISLDSVHE